eukprot:GEZU01024998.1.p2 GENE.GEZU01024998.1~~GEZU01024998.1.p2  ORF type:complete len:113 (+),score=17.03 GEZU01024998.1:40-378(+)
MISSSSSSSSSSCGGLEFVPYLSEHERHDLIHSISGVCGSLYVVEFVSVGKVLGFFIRGGPDASEICLVAQHHNDRWGCNNVAGVVVDVLAYLSQVLRERFEGAPLSYVVNQ